MKHVVGLLAAVAFVAGLYFGVPLIALLVGAVVVWWFMLPDEAVDRIAHKVMARLAADLKRKH